MGTAYLVALEGLDIAADGRPVTQAVSNGRNPNPNNFCFLFISGCAYTYRRNTQKFSQTFRRSQELMAKAERQRSENLRPENNKHKTRT